MLQTINLTKIYGKEKSEFTALKEVNITINDGERVAIVGKSGSGKSTLLHLIAGLDAPTSGSVLFDNQDYTKISKKEINQIRNKYFGFVFQQFFMQPQLSVMENVLLPLKIRRSPEEEREKMASWALEQVGLIDKKHNKSTDLSGGEKQRACLARALVNQPKVIFADEPTGNLDTENGDKISKLLFDLNNTGITLIFVTHNMDLANQCYRQIEIKDGCLVADRQAE